MPNLDATVAKLTRPIATAALPILFPMVARLDCSKDALGNDATNPFVQAVLGNDDEAATAALTAKSQVGASDLATRGAKELAYFTGGN
jgi:hypothetical protein